jgi:hypothetical protein
MTVAMTSSRSRLRLCPGAPFQILDRLAQQRPRLLWRQARQGRLVGLPEIVVAAVHSGARKWKSKLGRYPRTTYDLCLATR